MGILKVPFDVAPSAAFQRGRAAKRNNILEPAVPYAPGTPEYKDFAIGYLSSDYSDDLPKIEPRLSTLAKAV